MTRQVTWRNVAAIFLVLAIASSGLAQAQPSDTSPSGMVAFFMSSGAQCPAGWATATPAQGMVLVGRGDGAGVGTTVGLPMASETEPTHRHQMITSITIPSREIAALSCCNDQGAHSDVPFLVFGATDASTWNLPLIQLVVCQKQ